MGTLSAWPAPPVSGPTQSPVRPRMGTLSAWPAPPVSASPKRSAVQGASASGIRPVPRSPRPTLDRIDDADILEAVPVASSRPSGPPPAPRAIDRTAARRPTPDFIGVLRQDVGELELMGSAWQAAAVCAAALAKAFGARAVLIHAVDGPAREIRTIGVHGPKAHNVLGAVEPVDSDFVASSVVSYAEPMTMRFDGGLPRLAPARLGVVGAVSSLVAVPVMSGSCIAVIEIIDADVSASGSVTGGASFVAERLARFLGARAAAA